MVKSVSIDATLLRYLRAEGELIAPKIAVSICGFVSQSFMEFLGAGELIDRATCIFRTFRTLVLARLLGLGVLYDRRDNLPMRACAEAGQRHKQTCIACSCVMI